MKRTLRLFFVCALFVLGCAPAEPAISNTPTLIPTRISDISTEVDDVGGISSIPSQTPIPSETPTVLPTFTITPTSTLQPPLTAHEWSPEIVLISIRSNFGDGGTAIGDAGSPPLILYADGSMFISGTKNVNGRDYDQVLTKKLSRKEICQNLNTLDQIGYLDYDRSSYSFIGGRPLAIGYPDTFIAINAWKSLFDGFSGLDYFLQKDVIDEFYGQNGYPVILPALRDAYNFLTNYSADGFEVYKPNRLAIWIVPAEYIFPESFESIAQIWQLNKPSLGDLLKRVDLNPQSFNNTIIMKGNEALVVYNYLGEVENTQVFALDMPDGNKKYYALFARPLLPYEVLSDYGDLSKIPAPDSPKPSFKLTCYPSDGILSIPESLNP